MPVQLSREGRVAILVMDRPEARNAMNMEMTEQLDAAYEQLAEDDDIWVIVLTGAGDRAFCAGQISRKWGCARGPPRRRGRTVHSVALLGASSPSH